MGRAAFGFRQVGAVVMGSALAAGLSLQAIAAVTGTWAVGPDRVPPAWAVVDSSTTGRFRVLWVGPDDGGRFPAPGGDPDGLVEAGDASLRYGLTGRQGMLAVDMGRPLAGPGADALSASLADVVTGSTAHGGALLAPFGVRYLVAEDARIPEAARDAFDAQFDLDRVPAAGLLIWRNRAAIPPSSVADTTGTEDRLVLSSRLTDIQRIPPLDATPLPPAPGGWSGPTRDGTRVLLSTEFDGAWEMTGTETAPERSYGWATSFPTRAPAVTIRYGAQLPRTVASWLLAVVWAVALWVTRKPVRR
jgi:hypothetical protein